MIHPQTKRNLFRHYLSLFLVAVIALTGDGILRVLIDRDINVGQAAPAAYIPESESSECVVNLNRYAPYNAALQAEIGPLTKCIKYRKQVKVVLVLDDVCRDGVTLLKEDAGYPNAVTNVKLYQFPADCPAEAYNSATTGNPVTRPKAFLLGQLSNLLADLNARGVTAADRDIIVVASADGAKLLMTAAALTAKGGNPYVSNITTFMGQGVKFEVCLNTVKVFTEKGLLTENTQKDAFIPGVTFVEAGVSEIVDLQTAGYAVLTGAY